MAVESGLIFFEAAVQIIQYHETLKCKAVDKGVLGGVIAPKKSLGNKKLNNLGYGGV